MAPPDDTKVDHQKQATSIEKEMNAAIEERNKLLNVSLSLGTKLLGNQQDRLGLQAESVAADKKESAQKQAANEHLIAQAKKELELGVALSEEQRIKIQLLIEESSIEIEKQKKIQTGLEKKTKSLETQNKIYSASNYLFGSIAIKMGISNSELGNQGKILVANFAQLVKEENLLKAIYKTTTNIVGAFFDLFNPLNIISSLVEKIWTTSSEMLFRTSAAMANFTAAAGDAGEAAGDVAAAMNLATGVNIEEAAAAGGALAANWSRFHEISGPVRTSIVTMTAELDKLGMGAGDTSTMLESMTRTMGLSLPEAAKQMKVMVAMANDIGTVPANMGSDWAAAANDLSLYGGRMQKEFVELQKVAARTGIEMTALQQTANLFDNFESATKTAADLNMMLGRGQMIDGMEMMTMLAEEGQDAVLKHIKGTIDASGQTFADMHPFQRKAYAKILQMGGNEFAKYMSMSDEAREAEENKQKAEERYQKRYQRLLRKTVNLLARFEMWVQSIFADKEVMRAMNEFWGALMSKEVTDTLKKMVKTIAPIMTGFIKDLAAALPNLAAAAGTVWTALTKLFDYFFPASGDGEGVQGINAVGDAALRLADGFKEFVDSWTTSGSMWWSVTKHFTWEIAGLIGGIALAIVLALKVISIATFPFLSSLGWGISHFLTAVSVGIEVLGAATLSVAPGIITFAGVLLAVAGAIAMVVGAVAIGIHYMAEWNKEQAKNNDSMANLNTSTLAFAEGLRSFGDSDMQHVQGVMVTLGDAVEGFAENLEKLDPVKLHTMNVFLANVTLLSRYAADAMTDFAKAINDVGTALEKLPQGEMTAFSWNLTKVLKATSQVSTENSKGAVTVIKEAVKYQKEISRNPEQLDALVSLLRATNAAPAAGSAAGSGQTIIRLELGGTLLDKYIWDAVNGELTKYTR